MFLATWMAVGLIAGCVASQIVDKHGKDLTSDVVLGVMGAVVGGWLFDEFWDKASLISIVFASTGAFVVLFLYHAVIGHSEV